jgi:hypothetical protein
LTNLVLVRSGVLEEVEVDVEADVEVDVDEA